MPNSSASGTVAVSGPSAISMVGLFGLAISVELTTLARHQFASV